LPFALRPIQRTPVDLLRVAKLTRNLLKIGVENLFAKLGNYWVERKFLVLPQDSFFDQNQNYQNQNSQNPKLTKFYQ
jgi:hypothetical protein